MLSKKGSVGTSREQMEAPGVTVHDLSLIRIKQGCFSKRGFHSNTLG